MRKRLIALLILGLTVVSVGLFCAKDTYAAPSKGELTTKAYVNGIGKCSNSAFFAPEVDASNVRGFDSVIGNYSFGAIRNPNGLEGGTASAINCGKLFNEHVSTDKFPSYSPENSNAVNSALLDVGYKSGGATNGRQNCISINYRLTSDSSNAQRTTESLCFNVGSDENLTISADEISSRNDIPSASGDNVALGFGTCLNFPAYKCVLAYYGGEMHDVGSKQFSTSASWNDIVSDVQTAASNINNVISANGGSFIYHSATAVESSSGSSGTYVYDSTDNTANASKILNYLTGFGSWSSAAFNTTEQYWFYMYILTDYYGASIDATNCSGSQSGSSVAVKNEKGERRYCNVSAATNTNAGKVNMFSAGGSHYLDREGSYEDVLRALQSEVSADSIPVDDLYQVNEEKGTVVDDDDGGSDDGADDVSATDNCYGSPGTLGLSWILCPILSGMSNTLNKTYEDIVKNYLEVEPEFVSTDGTTYQAWQVFQNIANIILVIFLLVVIFSQLTGIGIDNYGIKKILPRLIICAVLINLSYFIVQFFVDVSNIVGSSINGIFSSLPNGSINISEIGSSTSLSIPSHVLGLSLTAGATAGVIAVVMNPAILLSFLFVLISGLISVLAMWLILMARKAGVVIAVIIAPIAFALYLLPNTSKLTKNWMSLLKSLLLVYPLAALLISASYYVSDLIGGGDNPNPDMILPAMLLRVVPFLALPSLFRKSLDAVGNLGTRIQGFGRTLSRGATGAIRGSDAYKTAQERSLERRTRIRAGLDQNGQEQTGWRGILRSRSARNRARYRSQYLKTQAEQGKADQLNKSEYMEAMLKKQEFEAAEAGRDATKYNQAGYIEGKEAQGRLSRDNEIANARFYNTPGYEASRISQYDEGRQSELRKMFEDRYESMTAGQKQDALKNLLTTRSDEATAGAEAEALIDSLQKKGDISELLAGLSLTTPEINAMNEDVLRRVAGKAIASGNPLLKGWAKSYTKHGKKQGMGDYIASGNHMANRPGDLANYLSTEVGDNAFNDADKDTLQYLRNNHAESTMSSSMLANIATTAANKNEKATQAVRDMLVNSGRLGGIGNNINAEGLTRMNETIARTLGPAHLSNAISEITKPANAQLLAKVDPKVRRVLGI